MSPGDARFIHSLVEPAVQEFRHFMWLWMIGASAVACFSLSLLVWFAEYFDREDDE